MYLRFLRRRSISIVLNSKSCLEKEVVDKWGSRRKISEIAYIWGLLTVRGCVKKWGGVTWIALSHASPPLVVPASGSGWAGASGAIKPGGIVTVTLPVLVSGGPRCSDVDVNLLGVML